MADFEPASIEVVFCAQDFSETAQGALDQAIRFARRHGAKLVVAHVVEPIPLGPYPAVLPQDEELAITDLARERLDRCVDAIRDQVPEVEAQIAEGEPGVELVRLAGQAGADLCVIGTRGLTGMKHLLLGSTAEDVIRRCACPVLTVHPEDRLLRDSIETVVLPTDLSDRACAAIDSFISLFGAWERPQIFLTYVDSAPPYLQPFRHETLERLNQRDRIREDIERQLQPIADRLRGADFEVEVAVLDGDPVTEVTELARGCGADLIMMCTRGRSALSDLLLGRTAQRIVQHAPCPCLTVRPKDRDE